MDRGIEPGPMPAVGSDSAVLPFEDRLNQNSRWALTHTFATNSANFGLPGTPKNCQTCRVDAINDARRAPDPVDTVPIPRFTESSHATAFQFADDRLHDRRHLFGT